MANNKDLISKFKGKVVSCGTAQDNLAIKNVTLETIEGRLFIVGQVPKGTTTNDWAADRECAVAWDSVIDYILFDSEEQYVESKDKSEPD